MNSSRVGIHRRWYQSLQASLPKRHSAETQREGKAGPGLVPRGTTLGVIISET